MESLRDFERRTIPSDPNFNFFSIGGEQREGSIAFSDISFPSHVSELESFQSGLDLSLCSRDSISTQGDLQLGPDRQSGVLEPASEPASKTRNHGDCEGTNSSMLPELPEQTSENINMLLAALKAATVKENESDCCSGNKSKSSSGISNQDSSMRFISKESFPESVFSQRSSTESLSWGKDLTLNPEELVHQPSSTPFSDEKVPPSSVQPGSDSRMSEKFLAPSKTPGPDPIDSSCPDSAASNPWSFSGTSMLLQTTVGNTFHQAENEPSCKANTTKKEKGESLLTSAIQKKLWTDTPERSSTSDHTLQRKDSTVDSPTTKEKVFNPFDDSIDVQTTFSNGLKDVQGCQDLFKDDEFSSGQEFHEDFSFQPAGDAASRLDKDEAMFMASHIFDKDVTLAGDNTIFGDGVLPDGRRKSERRSLPIIGINDPNDKGELRISFGDFFAAKTEELGRLGVGGEVGPRPQFSNTSLKVSPVAAIPRPLHRPSSPEGGEGDTLPRQSSNKLRSDQPKPQISDQNIDSLHHRNPSVKRSSPSGAEDRTEDKAKQEKNERRKVEKEKEREKQTDENEKTRRDSADPNSSAIAALKFCHSSQGSKILGMSAGELQSLSSTLAKVTQGDPREIYKVLVDFICEERRLSQTTSELEDSYHLSDVFFSEKKKGRNDSTTVDRTLYEEQDEVTFYHSDTSCEVSPTGSKFERLATAIPSPPLDSSSPKSTASSIAVQTESHEDHVTRASTQVSTSIPYHTVTTSIVGSGRSACTSKTSEQYPRVHPSVQLPEGLTSVAHQTSVPSTGVLPSALITVQDKYPPLTSSHIGVPIGHQDTVMTRNQAHLTANQAIVGTMGMTAELVPSSEQMNLAAMASQTYDTSAVSSGSSAGMMYPMSVSSAGFASQPVPHSVALAWQPVPKGRTISGSHPMFYDKQHVVGKSVQPRPRSAFDGHGFFTLPAPVKNRGNLGDSSGMYKEMAQLNTRVHTWDSGSGGGGGTNVNTISHRQEGWNWRTERTSQIQMVIPPALDFPGVLCVGMSAEALLPLHNPTSRWIRCSSVIISCTANGVKVNHLRDCPFSIRETTLIGPKLTENVKVEFLCMVAGIYVAEMKVVSTPVGSIDGDSETSSALVTLQGFSEKPQLEIFADDGQTLDFGELHHGCNNVRPLRIDNKGRTKIPLKMLICSSSSPGIFVFSKNNSPDAIENLQIQSSALKCLLPATNDLDLKPQPLTIWIEMVGKNHNCFEKSNEAEIFSAGINIQLDVGAVPKILGNVPLKGVIGFTKIQIPKAFQMAMCLSSSVGRKVSRQLPFSNAGNISAKVELTIPKYSDVFVAAPNKFQVRPETAVMVEVSFSPRVKGSYESVIQVSELGDSKSYEVLLRGSSIEPQTTVEEEGPPILSNKSCLCWTGVDIGKATHQRLFLLNDSSERSVHFQAVILGEHADFAIQRMRSDFSSGTNSSEPMSLRPKERIPIYVLFAPSSLGVFKSALVLKPDRGPRFQVPLYAYGGTSELSICGQSKTPDGYVADLGQISLGHRNILKITLKNSGNRAAFVKAACYSDVEIRLLYPNTHLSIVPSEFILPERSSKELVIVFQPLQHDAKACQTQVKRVATVVFYYGDEVLRQWYKRNLTKQHDYQGRKSNENSRLHDLRLDKVFEDENCVAEEFDYPAVENWSEVFNSHLTQVPLDLMGGPERLETAKSSPDDGGSTLVMATGQTPAQKGSGTEKNKATESGDNNKTAMWTIIPERLSLKVPVEGSTDTTKKVQLLNFSDRPLEFEFIWPGHCVAVTPHRGTIPPKNQTVVHVGVWASISSSGIELPWCGTAYVNCDGTKKELAIQIHRNLVNEGSPAPSVINKPLTLLDPDQDRTLLLQAYTKPQKHTPPLTVTPKRIEFPETEVGSVTSSTVALSNVSTSSVRWKVSSVAPAYSKVSQTSTELFRATYAVFRFSSRGGLLRPGQTVKIDVEFQTRDPGEYCQMWDVQTNPESPLTSTKTQMELSGKTVAQKVTSGVLAEIPRGKLRVSDPVCEREPVATLNVLTSHEMPSKQTTESTKGNLNIYFESDNIWFPNTEVGETSAVKIKICNRSSTSHKFRIVNPQPPFSVKCLNILTKPTHYLRIPVYFSPNEPSKHYEETVVFSNSKSGALLSVKLQGNSLPAK